MKTEERRLVETRVSMEELGARLKAARTTRGWSLADLAKASGVSTSFLSLVENGKSDISIGRLVRLTDTLDVTLADLIDPESAIVPNQSDLAQYKVMRRGDRPWIDSDVGIRTHLLLSSTERSIERLVLTCEPGASVDTSEFERRRRGETFLLMIAGGVRVGFRDGSNVRLRRGDSISFPSHLVTSCANEARSVAEIYVEWPWR